MKILSIILLFFFIMLSCNTAPPKQAGENNSAIGITIAADSLKLINVIFIKLDSIEDSLIKNSVFFSDYSYGSWWGNIKSGTVDNFLMDIQPGIYAAVAAYAQERGGSDFLILFPEKMIKATIVELKSNTMLYNGKYFLSFKNINTFFDQFRGEIRDADIIQKYYYKPLRKEFYKHNISIVKLFTITPLFQEMQKSNDIEKAFLMDYQSIFNNTDWEEKIKNRLKELEQMK